MPPPTLLVVDPSPEDRGAVLRQVGEAAEGGWRTVEVSTIAEALDALAKDSPAAMVLEAVLPDGTAVDFLREAANRQGGLTGPAIICAAGGGPRDAVAALQSGASDFILKAEAGTLLAPALRRAMAGWVGAHTPGRPEDFARLYAAARGEIENLRAANAAKDDFLAMLSHELRTPLTPVLSLVSSTLADTELSADLRETFAMVQRNVELEARLIDDLLDLTQISTGRLKIEKAPVDIHRCIEAALDVCQASFEQKRITVRTEFAAGKPLVLGEFARLNQVLWNLLKNAAKFSKPHGQVTISTSDEEGGVGVDIRDEGMGIEPSRIEGIFGTSPIRPHPTGTGLGLGLAIARAIVQGHGGTIRAQSEGKDKGAVFHLSLPCAAALPATAEEAPSASSAVVRGKTIMVVEDHEDTRRVLSRALRRKGFGVTMAGSVAAAEEQFAAIRADLVVCDIGLPDGTGWDLLPKLRLHGAVKAIAVSGYGMMHDVEKSHQAGFLAHLTKPIDFPRLEGLIVESLSS